MPTLIERARANADLAIWKPTVPDEAVEGVVVKMTIGGKFDSTFYHLKQDDGVIVIVPASPTTVLGRELAEHNILVDDRVAIVYLGEGTNKTGQKFKKWAIAVERGEQSLALAEEKAAARAKKLAADDLSF